MTSNTKALLQEQLAKLSAERDEILSRSTPLRAERDRIKNEAREQVKKIDEKVKEIEAPLFKLSNEIGMLARALGGRRMSESRK